LRACIRDFVLREQLAREPLHRLIEPKGADQSVLEDAVAQTIPSWATAISPGPGDSDALVFTVSTTNPTLFSVPPAVAANGTLTYAAALNRGVPPTASSEEAGICHHAARPL